MKSSSIVAIACIAMLLLVIPAAMSSPSAQTSGDCTPGDTWKVECNTCTCTSTGIAACTRKGCLSVPQN